MYIEILSWKINYSTRKHLIGVLSFDLLTQKFQRIVAGYWDKGDGRLFPNAQAVFASGNFEVGERLSPTINPMIFHFAVRLGMSETTDNQENTSIVDFRFKSRSNHKKFIARFKHSEVHVGPVALAETSSLTWIHFQVARHMKSFLVLHSIAVNT